MLSDKQKRTIYDQLGEEGLKGGGGPPPGAGAGMGGNPFAGGFPGGGSTFSFSSGPGGGFGGGFFGGGGSRSQGPRRTKDLVHRVHVSLEELYRGKTTKLALTRSVICSKCKGKGGKEGAVQQCTTCRGRGIKVTMRQMGPMIQQIQSPCDDCGGAGENINPKDRCSQCKGKKVVPDKKMLEVHIDKGMKGGDTITFRGESDQSPTAEPGDVIIVVEEKPHERFKRQDDDLIYEHELDLLSALAGGQFIIRHLDDRALVVKLEPGEVIKNGTSQTTLISAPHTERFIDDLKVIHGQGMPQRRVHEPGDLFVKFTVRFPDHIDVDKIHFLEQALPPRDPIPKLDKNIHLEEVELSTPDARRSHMRDPDAMDEDEGEPRVQCANQ